MTMSIVMPLGLVLGEAISVPRPSSDRGRQDGFRSDSRRSEGNQQLNPQCSSGGGRQGGSSNFQSDSRRTRGNDFYPQRFSGGGPDDGHGGASRGLDSRRNQQGSTCSPRRDGNGSGDRATRPYSRLGQENNFNSPEPGRQAGNDRERYAAGSRDGSRGWGARGQGRGSGSLCVASGRSFRAPALRRGLRTVTRAAARETEKRPYRIVTLPGDGIGPEIMTVAMEVLRSVGERQGIHFSVVEKHVGGAAIDAAGVPLPDDTLAACQDADAVLLAAIGGYKWDSIPTHLRPEQGLLALRAGLGVFANLRPATVLPQLADASTLKREIAEGVDIMVVRELIGGIYFGTPKGFGVTEEGHKYAYNTMVYSVPEIDRIARVAFETARKRKGKLCSVDKANVLSVSQLWRQRVTEIGADEYSDVELSHMYVDNAAMQLIRNPKQFDTIVTGNLFGDILSDISAMLSGSIGMLASASISSSGPGLYEPIHGSAPDIAGQDKANPMAQVLSVAMMLRYGLGEEQAATAIESAVSEVLDKGYRTGDITSPGKTLVGCKKMGELLLEALGETAPVPLLR